ncbi:Hypothetical protein FKW44_018966 [Caligus rogercresseyi]|uniref:Uncharacterized protein n=1 Tax=Caligus rogercresseyi TaxID=217165 RepID=A0A7T8GVM9_CALRO|nr:Hypothetical protein FKW44_018966 [Caligus rogercresseyi]
MILQEKTGLSLHHNIGQVKPLMKEDTEDITFLLELFLCSLDLVLINTLLVSSFGMK